MGEVARIDLETGEVTEFRPQEITAHGLFHIPESISEVASIVGHAMGLAYASHWGTAALVWAWTEETKGGRPSKTCPKVGRLSLSEFAALGIRGLTKRDTVAKYRAGRRRLRTARLPACGGSPDGLAAAARLLA